MQQSFIGKISQKNRNKIGNTPAQNTPKETILSPENVTTASGNNTVS